jgi:hypothetical protein
MPTRGLRRAAAVQGFATPQNCPIYVDSDDDILKVIPAGSGTTEKQVIDASSTQTLTNKTLTAPTLTAPVISGAATIATGSVITSATITDAVINTALIAGGATLTLTAATHGGKTIALDTLTGTTITLPAATGSGVHFRFLVSVAATSNQHRINVVGNDAFFGQIISGNDSDNTVVAFPTAADADQINWNGGSTGGLKGAWLELVDMVADGWSVWGITDASGTEATPFATGQVS